MGGVVTGVELAVGYVCAWLVSKARRVAGRADAEVDRGLDAGMQRLHELVSGALREDPALRRAGEEAETEAGTISERTRRRLTDALAEAADRDEAFAAALAQAVAALPPDAVAGGVVTGGVVTGGGSIDVHADNGSVAAVRMGDVRVGNPSRPGPPEG